MLSNEAFFKISYGLYLISTEFEGHKNAYIANTAFQVTAKPERFAISCHKDNLSSELIMASKKFAFAILEKDVDQKIISKFGYNSGKDNDKFEDVNYFISELGNPILKEGIIAYFECELEQSVDVGTHILFIGLLKAGKEIDLSKQPLTYADYRDLRNGKAPKNAPTYVEPEKKEKTKDNVVSKSTKYECLVCGYIYDPEKGDPDSDIPPGTPFEDLPDDWMCPDCGAGKEDFEPIN